MLRKLYIDFFPLMSVGMYVCNTVSQFKIIRASGDLKKKSSCSFEPGHIEAEQAQVW